MEALCKTVLEVLADEDTAKELTDAVEAGESAGDPLGSGSRDRVRSGTVNVVGQRGASGAPRMLLEIATGYLGA